MQRVYPELPGQEMHPEGDLIWFVDLPKVYLFRVVETYMEPSQGVIDKIAIAGKPYNYDDSTKVFRVLEEVACARGTLDDVKDELAAYLPEDY